MRYPHLLADWQLFWMPRYLRRFLLSFAVHILSRSCLGSSVRSPTCLNPGSAVLPIDEGHAEQLNASVTARVGVLSKRPHAGICHDLSRMWRNCSVGMAMATFSAMAFSTLSKCKNSQFSRIPSTAADPRGCRRRGPPDPCERRLSRLGCRGACAWPYGSVYQTGRFCTDQWPSWQVEARRWFVRPEVRKATNGDHVAGRVVADVQQGQTPHPLEPIDICGDRKVVALPCSNRASWGALSSCTLYSIRSRKPWRSGIPRRLPAPSRSFPSMWYLLSIL